MRSNGHTARLGRPPARFALLAAATLAATGCERPAPATGSTQAQAPAPDDNAVLRSRWRAMFADPARVRQAANEFGYQVGAYALVTGGKRRHRMSGVEQVLPGGGVPTHVSTNFSASGNDAGQLDRIEFSFDIVRPERSPTSRKEHDALQIPRRAVQGFLGRFEVGPGDAVKRGLQDFTDASYTTPAVRIVVTARRLGPGRDRLVVDMTPG